MLKCLYNEINLQFSFFNEHCQAKLFSLIKILIVNLKMYLIFLIFECYIDLYNAASMYQI